MTLHDDAGGSTALDSYVDIASLVRPDRVDGDVYTSPEVYELELKRIFREGWAFVAHESEVPERGDYLTRMLGGEPVIVVRGKDGGVRVLANRCTHRGNRLCNAEQGNSSSFRCPYHGWTFANDGHLVA